jgi:very-short-patch-repair endonuclease
LARAVRALARRQHWVITRAQLLAVGYTEAAIDHRIRKGRLHPIYPGVFAVDRRALPPDGYFMAAVLASGSGAALSDDSAGELYGIRPRHRSPIHVSVIGRQPRRRGIKVHRRSGFKVVRHRGIPVTSIIDTLVDLATTLDDDELERAVNEAVNRNLTDPERLRRAVAAMRHRPGARTLARLLDRGTYAVTESRLEQRFLRVAREAGLPKPQTQRHLEGGRVDFFWPALGLIVEADSLRYHRTPAQQAADVLRDQKHAGAELTPLRFTHWQIFFDAAHVQTILVRVTERLAGERVVPVGGAAQ